MLRSFVFTFGAFLAFALFSPVVSAQRISITGVLAPTVEAGGWLLVDDNEKYLVLNAGSYTGESWFRSGARVAATGEIRREVVTIYQEGVPFEATTLVPNSTDTNRGPRTSITVSGDARVTATPDTATLSIAVVTQNPSAREAQQQNAVQSTAVIEAAKNAAGARAEIRTSGYSLTPQRVYKENQPPTITGYEARNTITVTLSDLARVGAVIDAAAKAGANNIDSVSFSLRQDREARGRALAEATRDASAKAATLAQALGGRVVRIVAVQEGGAGPRPMIFAQQDSFARTAADTPIEPGTLEIHSQVQLMAEVETAAPPR